MSKAQIDRLVGLGMSPELAAVFVDLVAGGGSAPATSVTVAAFTKGGVTFAGGNAQQAIEAVATATGS